MTTNDDLEIGITGLRMAYQAKPDVAGPEIISLVKRFAEVLGPNELDIISQWCYERRNEILNTCTNCGHKGGPMNMFGKVRLCQDCMNKQATIR